MLTTADRNVLLRAARLVEQGWRRGATDYQTKHFDANGALYTAVGGEPDDYITLYHKIRDKVPGGVLLYIWNDCCSSGKEVAEWFRAVAKEGV